MVTEFNGNLPDNIKPHHYREWCNSAIAHELIIANLRSVQGDEISAFLSLGASWERGDYKNNGGLKASYLKPYQEIIKTGGWLFQSIALDGLSQYDRAESGFGQLKPDQPRLDRDGDIIKYESPKHLDLELLLPFVPTEIWDKVAARYGIRKSSDSFWSWVSTHNIPIIICEGIKKALALLSQGYVAIGLCGIHGLIKDGELRQSIAPFLSQGREFVFCFDKDEKPATQAAVTSAITNTSKLLQNHKHKTTYITWGEKAKGVDDLIFHFGPDAFGIAYDLRSSTDELRWKKVPTADTMARILFQDKDLNLLPYTRFVVKGQIFYCYNDRSGVWEQVRDEFLESFIYDYLERNRYTGYSDKYLRAVLTLIKRNKQIIVDKLPINRDNIPFNNGVLVLKTGELKPHSHLNYITWKLPYDYNSASLHLDLADSFPKIMQFLNEATNGNKEYIKILLYYCAATLRGMSYLQKFLHIQGPGGSGKGTFERQIFRPLIGLDNCACLNFSDLERPDNLVRLENKPAIIFNDSGSAPRYALDIFKQLTGQDPLLARPLFKESYNFTSSGMVLVTSNQPIFAYDSASNWATRRTILIPFNNVCLQPKNLDFSDELGNLATYLLSIAPEEIEDTLRGVGRTYTQSELWENQCRSSALAAWVNDWLIFDPETETQIGSDAQEWDNSDYMEYSGNSTLYGSYIYYCKRNKRTNTLSTKNFTANLLEILQLTLKQEVIKIKGRSFNSLKGVRIRRFSESSGDLDIPPIEELLIDKKLCGGLKPLQNQGVEDNQNLEFLASTEKPLPDKDCGDCGDCGRKKHNKSSEEMSINTHLTSDSDDSMEKTQDIGINTHSLLEVYEKNPQHPPQKPEKTISKKDFDALFSSSTTKNDPPQSSSSSTFEVGDIVFEPYRPELLGKVIHIYSPSLLAILWQNGIEALSHPEELQFFTKVK